MRPCCRRCSAAAVNFTEQNCSPTSFQWGLDTYAYPRSAVLASGDYARKKWFFIAIDNVVGQTGVETCTAAIQEAGGSVVGTVKHPINTTDFASFIVQAQSSKADVVVCLSGGTDQSRMLTQMREFGLQAGGQFVVAPILTYADILAAGLPVAQGIRFADGYYWNANDAARAFAKRFQDKMGRAPGASNAQTYAAVTHYLRAVEAAKTTEGKAVAAQMRSLPVNAPFWRNASIRPNGRVIYDLHVIRVKTPAQSTGKFDVAEVMGSLAGDKVFKPLAQSVCKLA